MNRTDEGPGARAMPDVEARIGALVAVAERWQDPAYEPRAEAEARTLEQENTFTEAALVFAVNQQMHALTAASVRAWHRGRVADRPRRVGVLNAANVPLVGLQDLVAVLVTGHAYVGVVSSRSSYLLPAFAEEVRHAMPGLPVAFTDAEAMFGTAEAVIASGTDETAAWVHAQAAAQGLPPERRLVRGHRYSVAVIDGRETPEEREALAEDVWLHEGRGCRNVAVLWAPQGLDADPYFDAFAAFRGIFPAHPTTAASVKMPQAFLAATKQPHAMGEDFSFLVSRGDPEPQRPGHLRWAEYADLATVHGWLDAHRDDLQLVLARPRLAERLRGPVPTAALGEGQRPPLDWCPDGVDVIDFLARL